MRPTAASRVVSGGGLTRRDALKGLVAAAAFPASAWATAPGSGVIRVEGGTIHTGIAGRPTVESMVSVDGRLIHTGPRDVALQIAPRARVVDLGGGHAYPGFVDGHVHLLDVGLRASMLDLEGVNSLAELKRRLQAWAGSTSGPIVGDGWIDTHWPEGRLPIAADLDEVVSDRPVFLSRADGHAAVVNRAALRLAGIGPDTRDPPGGAILRDESGVATGVLVDAATDLVADRLPKPTVAEKRLALRRAAALYADRGWTGVHEMSVDAENLHVLFDLAAADELPMRVDVYMSADSAEEVLARGPYRDSTGRVCVRGVKLFMDGALGSRSAALFRPYSDAPGTSGLLMMTTEELAEWCRRARKARIQLATHAIGDRAIRLVLDAYESALAGDRTRRWRIEHAQVIDPADIPRFAQLGVIASMQPSHAISDLYFAPTRLGHDRLTGAYAWRRLVDAGATVCGGTDAPVEQGDPRVEFYAAVYRHAVDGFAGKDWSVDQVLTRPEALALFTTAAARAAGDAGDLGVLAPGQRAAFSVFDRDLLAVRAEELLKLRASNPLAR